MNPLHKFALLPALAFASLALADLQFDLEPGVEHVSGRGLCIDHRIPANSLVTGAFFAEPISGASPPRILATVAHIFASHNNCTRYMTRKGTSRSADRI